jgi:hypothetical protein
MVLRVGVEVRVQLAAKVGGEWVGVEEGGKKKYALNGRGLGGKSGEC